MISLTPSQWEAYAYADKAREGKRKASLLSADKTEKERQQTRQARRQQNKKNQAWSNKLAREEEKDVRKEKRAKKRDWQKRAEAKEISQTEVEDSFEGKGDSGIGSVELDDSADWKELQQEERSSKKLKAVSIGVFDDL